jgi:hypothetical protein
VAGENPVHEKIHIVFLSPLQGIWGHITGELQLVSLAVILWGELNEEKALQTPKADEGLFICRQEV